MLGLLKAVPHRFVILFFTHALAFSLGLAYANSWATRTALEVQADVFSKREADVGRALILKAKDDQKRLHDAAGQERRAYEVAYNLFQEGMTEAADARETAERKLAGEFEKTKQLTENRDALLMVNKMLAEEFPVPEPPRGCVLSSGVRNAINAYIESINNRPAVGDSPSTGSSLPDGSNSASAVLECERLAYFVTEILEHDALLTAWLLSFQEWERSVAK